LYGGRKYTKHPTFLTYGNISLACCIDELSNTITLQGFIPLNGCRCGNKAVITNVSAVTRQMIEGKLSGLRYQPENVQVVVQGKEERAALFLVNEVGVIVSIATCNMHAHVTHVQSKLAHGAPLAQSHEGNETGHTGAQVALE